MGRSHKKKIIMFLFVSFFLILSGCQNVHDHQIRYHSEKAIETEFKTPFSSAKSIVTYRTNMDRFRFVVGWTSDKEILISESNGEGDVIFSYNIENGERKDRFYSDQPIISASISPAKTYLLIHTSPISYEASIQIYRLDTDELVFKKTLESNEISFEWDHDREENLLIVTFYEDWTFQPYILHIDEKRIEAVELPQPFVHWFDDQSWVLLNWNNEVPSMTAPLAVYKKGWIENVFPEKNFYFVDRLDDFYFAIGISEMDEGEAEFIFLDKKFHPFFTYHAPHLSTFSGWKIPHYSYIEKTKEFIFIKPLENGEADIYQGGFQLVKLNLESGKESILLNEIDDAPIDCSPDGTYCLTGRFSEKMIELNTGEIFDIIDFS